MRAVSTYIEYVHVRPEYDELLYKLSQANHFTMADLESNRAGKVGVDQLRHHLRETLMAPLMVLGGGFLVSFITRVAFAAYVEHTNIFSYVGTLIGHLLTFQLDKLRQVYLTTAGQHLPIIVAAFVITAPAIGWKKMRKIPWKILVDLFTGGVIREEGQVNTTTEEVKAPGRDGKQGETVDLHYYLINDAKISVTSSGVKELALGLRYKVYYLRLSKQLLSIEPLLN